MMSQQKQQLLKQELTISQILRTHGKQFVQIKKQYSDGHNGTHYAEPQIFIDGNHIFQDSSCHPVL
jgi:hypothetical protein